jgi:hypothetical protein
MSYDSLPPLVSNGGSLDPDERDGGTEYRPRKYKWPVRIVQGATEGLSRFDITLTYSIPKG